MKGTEIGASVALRLQVVIRPVSSIYCFGSSCPGQGWILRRVSGLGLRCFSVCMFEQ